jgi:hypothetical protein
MAVLDFKSPQFQIARKTCSLTRPSENYDRPKMGKSRTTSCYSDRLIGSDAAGIVRQQNMSPAAHCASQHGPDKEARTENAAGIAGSIAGCCSHKLESNKQGHRAQRHLTIESLVHVVVPYAEDRRNIPAQDADQQAACSGLEPLCPGGHALKILPQPEQKLTKQTDTRPPTIPSTA